MDHDSLNNCEFDDNRKWQYGHHRKYLSNSGKKRQYDEQFPILSQRRSLT